MSGYAETVECKCRDYKPWMETNEPHPNPRCPFHHRTKPARAEEQSE